MNSKQKKQILENFSQIEGRIKELEQEQKNSNFDTIEEAKKIVDLINGEKKELLETQSQIMLAIRKLSNITERRIIHLKYIGKKDGLYHKTLPLWKIANELGYSPDYINHLHGDALQHLDLLEK